MRDISLSDWPGDNSLFEKPSEDETPATRCTTIKAEGVLFQVGLEMVRGYRPLMSTQEPSFEQVGDPMHTRHGNVGWLVR